MFSNLINEVPHNFVKIFVILELLSTFFEYGIGVSTAVFFYFFFVAKYIDMVLQIWYITASFGTFFL